MKDFINKLYQNHSMIYKVFLFIITTSSIVYMFPKGGHFGLDIQKGKPWQSDNLYAPFDFAIQKSEAELEREQEQIEANKELFFVYNQNIVDRVKTNFAQKAQLILPDSLFRRQSKRSVINFGQVFLDEIYKTGYLEGTNHGNATANQIITLRKGNEAEKVVYNRLVQQGDIQNKIRTYFNRNNRYRTFRSVLTNILLEVLEPNVYFDNELTQQVVDDQLKNISKTKGLITENERIISKGDVVEGKKYEILMSLKKEYESQLWSKSNYNWIVFGYILLVALVLLMLLLFMKNYRAEIFENNTMVTFIFFNVLLMVFLVTLVVKYRVEYLYVVPLIILPIILKAFFDARLGLFTHVLTVLLLGFIVPNSFEFIFLQTIAGIVTILTVSELYRRANLFISISQITLVYMVAYFAFSVIQEGNATQLKYDYFGWFALNGVLSFLSLLFILVYEKVFNLVSDVSLLELSNTNSKLLRELAEKAPGTFQHSMQVANLAEASANEIGANAMLVRTGALYHDLGKMTNPMYFTENQTTNVNPHHELTPKDSAKIIIDHVIKGIGIAKKNGLPDRIIDFIRTHHGTSQVYYFYKKQEEFAPNQLDIEDFTYPGPIPFSKETAILMMCDAAEAASKSIKEPTAQLINDLIDRIVETQMNNNQFLNADITFKEIESIKKVIKKKLHNIYHLRIEYPE
ncbi:MAG: HDIG domain-containing protein [Flavobacteriaceae bacterium]|nr:HDIG domain-containing protein [Flavobacteriaceae bacterium]